MLLWYVIILTAICMIGYIGRRIFEVKNDVTCQSVSNALNLSRHLIIYLKFGLHELVEHLKNVLKTKGYLDDQDSKMTNRTPLDEFEKIVYDYSIGQVDSKSFLKNQLTLKAIHTEIFQVMKKSDSIHLIYNPYHILYFTIAARFFQVIFISIGILLAFNIGYRFADFFIILLPASFFLLQISWIPSRVTTLGLKYLKQRDSDEQKKNDSIFADNGSGWM